MPNITHDILMITYNRPEFTRKALGQLLETCDSYMRVWVWHNGGPGRTLDVVNEFRTHPKFYHLHCARENKALREPTNWFWKESDAVFLSKVDDDCLMPRGWGKELRETLSASPQLGITACWLYYESDYVPELAEKKTIRFPGGAAVMSHHHVQGSGYAMKREVYRELGQIKSHESFTGYCQRVAASGWVVGWRLPFLCLDHMDDPRSPNYPFKTDEEFLENRSLSATGRGIESLHEWKERSIRQAQTLQSEHIDPRELLGLRGRLRRRKERIRLIFRGRQ